MTEIKIKWSVRALAARMKVSIEELAKMSSIEPNHLKQVSAGRIRMTAYDLQKLAETTGIPAELIEVA